MNCVLYHTLMTEDNFAVASRIKRGLETVFASHKHTPTHFKYPSVHLLRAWNWSPSQLPSGERRGAPWMSHQLLVGSTYTDGRAYTHTHSHLQPVEVQMTPKCMSLECGSKENLHRERTHGENMQPPHRKATVDFKQWAHSKKRILVKFTQCWCKKATHTEDY